MGPSLAYTPGHSVKPLVMKILENPAERVGQLFALTWDLTHVKWDLTQPVHGFVELPEVVAGCKV
jgi:hypothetical protein